MVIKVVKGEIDCESAEVIVNERSCSVNVCK